MNFAWRIYRWLGRAFPHEFKLAYAQQVTQLGEDIFEDIARRHGAAGLIRLIADIAIRVPLEYLSEMRRDMYFAGRVLRKSVGRYCLAHARCPVLAVPPSALMDEMAHGFRPWALRGRHVSVPDIPDMPES